MKKYKALFGTTLCILTAFILCGCGSSSQLVNSDSSESQITEETDNSIEYSTLADNSIEYSTLTDNLYIPIGESVTYYIQNGQKFDVSGTNSEIVEINAVDSFLEAACDKTSYASDVENGQYYALYSKCMNGFITAEEHSSGTGLLMAPIFDPSSCSWKAVQSADGVYLENESGYLQYDAEKGLICGETGSAFTLVPSNDANYSESFGFLTSVSDSNYRLDCFSAEQISTYPDDGVVYAHTCFYLCNVTEETVSYTKARFTGYSCGDTVATSGEKTYQIHVYNPSDMYITFADASQTVSVPGYELEDGDIHDCGFYTYQCDLENNSIVFTAVSEGKERVQIGHFSYNVTFGGAECSYNSVEYSSFFEAVRDAVGTVENPRLSNKKIVLLNDDILYDGTLPVGVVIDFNGHYGADGNDVMMSYKVPNSGAENSTQSVIYPVIQGDVQYMYLPSFADYSKLQLTLPEGTVISSENGSSVITTSSFNEAIDLSQIFGDMSAAGAVFPIMVTWESGNMKIIQNVILMKSANVESVFFELSENGITDMPEWITSSKSNRPDKAKAVILTSDGEITYDGKIKTFHARGNTNVGIAESKVGYAFKLKERLALAGNVESKAWVLSPNAAVLSSRDTSSYATSFGDTLYQRMNTGADADYAVQYMPIDVYINGEYRGMYILTDKINDTRFDMNINEYLSESEENLQSETDPSDLAIAAGVQKYNYDANAVLISSGGFIIEINGYGLSSYGFTTSRNVSVEIKSPETPTKEQVQSIALYFQKFEDALYSQDTSESKLSDYVDFESMAKVYLVKCFLKDIDYFWGSTYFYIDADDTGFTTCLKSCTAWDFDGCSVITSGEMDNLFNSSFGRGGSALDYKWQLLEHKEFTETLTRLNNDKVFENNSMSFVDIVSDMTADGNFIDTYYEQVNNSMCMNKSVWPFTYWYDTITDTMKQCINGRLSVWETLIPESGGIFGIPE